MITIIEITTLKVVSDFKNFMKMFYNSLDFFLIFIYNIGKEVITIFKEEI